MDIKYEVWLNSIQSIFQIHIISDFEWGSFVPTKESPFLEKLRSNQASWCIENIIETLRP